MSAGQGPSSGYYPSAGIAGTSILAAAQNTANGNRPALYTCGLTGGLCLYADISAGQGVGSGKKPRLAIDNAGGRIYVVTQNGANSDRPGLFNCSLAGTGCVYTDISIGEGATSGTSPDIAIDAANRNLLIVTQNGARGGILSLFTCPLNGTRCWFTDLSLGQGVSSGFTPSILVDAPNNRFLVATQNAANNSKPALTICALNGTQCFVTDISAGQGANSGLMPTIALDYVRSKILVVTYNQGTGGQGTLFRCGWAGQSCTASALTTTPNTGWSPRLLIDTVADAMLIATQNTANGDKPALFRSTGCGAGFVISFNSTVQCIPCDPGSALGTTGWTNFFCPVCLAGQYAPNYNYSACLPCPAGTAVATTGAVICPACPNGTVSTSGQSSCTTCVAGSFSTSNLTTCLACSGGFSSPAGSAGCSVCPEGTFSTSGTACQQCNDTDWCPAGSIAPLSSAWRDTLKTGSRGRHLDASDKTAKQKSAIQGEIIIGSLFGAFLAIAWIIGIVGWVMSRGDKRDTPGWVETLRKLDLLYLYSHSVRSLPGPHIARRTGLGALLSVSAIIIMMAFWLAAIVEMANNNTDFHESALPGPATTSLTADLLVHAVLLGFPSSGALCANATTGACGTSVDVDALGIDGGTVPSCSVLGPAECVVEWRCYNCRFLGESGLAPRIIVSSTVPAHAQGYYLLVNITAAGQSTITPDVSGAAWSTIVPPNATVFSGEPSIVQAGIFQRSLRLDFTKASEMEPSGDGTFGFGVSLHQANPGAYVTRQADAARGVHLVVEFDDEGFHYAVSTYQRWSALLFIGLLFVFTAGPFIVCFFVLCTVERTCLRDDDYEDGGGFASYLGPASPSMPLKTPVTQHPPPVAQVTPVPATPAPAPAAANGGAAGAASPGAASPSNVTMDFGSGDHASGPVVARTGGAQAGSGFPPRGAFNDASPTARAGGSARGGTASPNTSNHFPERTVIQNTNTGTGIFPARDTSGHASPAGPEYTRRGGFGGAGGEGTTGGGGGGFDGTGGGRGTGNTTARGGGGLDGTGAGGGGNTTARGGNGVGNTTARGGTGAGGAPGSAGVAGGVPGTPGGGAGGGGGTNGGATAGAQTGTPGGGRDRTTYVAVPATRGAVETESTTGGWSTQRSQKTTGRDGTPRTGHPGSGERGQSSGLRGRRRGDPPISPVGPPQPAFDGTYFGGSGRAPASGINDGDNGEDDEYEYYSYSVEDDGIHPPHRRRPKTKNNGMLSSDL